jgi:hypothetical protein
MRAPLVGKTTKSIGMAVIIPFALLCVVSLIAWGPEALGGAAFFAGTIIAPIGIILWFTGRLDGRLDDQLKKRARSMPKTPKSMIVSEDPGFELDSVDLPLFSRPLANLWTKVVLVQSEGPSIRLFGLVHADMLGEGSMRRTTIRRPWRPLDGMTVVSCALVLVDADMPLIVVRPRHERPFTLPSELRERDTELESFNRSFQVFSKDAYAATAIVDQRTIDAIQRFDPGTGIEIGGPAILLYSSRRGSSSRLSAQAARLAQAFPRVAASLFPAAPAPPAD